jgi:hypothetical protein
VIEEKKISNLHAIERRVDRRILVHVPVQVIEIDAVGQQMIERTYIEDVSDFGCRFSTRLPVKNGETIAVKVLGRFGNELPEEDARLYEIMWVAPKDRGFAVGARLLQGEKLERAGASLYKLATDNGGKKQVPK